MEKGQGQILDAVIKLVAQAANDIFADIIHEIFLAVSSQSPDQKDDDDRHRKKDKTRGIFVDKHIVNNGPNQIAHGRCGGCDHQTAYTGNDEAVAVLFDMPQNTTMPLFEFEFWKQLQTVFLPNGLAQK